VNSLNSSRLFLFAAILSVISGVLFAGTVSSLDLAQKGYSATVSYCYSESFPLALSAEVITAENGFLDYGLSAEYRRDSSGSVNIEGALAFTFTLIKQDTYMPVSLTVEPELLYAGYISGDKEGYEATGLRFASTLLSVIRTAHRQFLTLGMIGELSRYTYTSSSSSQLPYTLTEFHIGPTVRYTMRNYPLTGGNSGELRLALMFDDQWSHRLRVGFSFLRYKEAHSE